MVSMGEFSLFILLVASGLIIWLVVWLLMRLVPRLRGIQRKTRSAQTGQSSLVQSHTDAALVVQSGGRIVDMNSPARELFNLQPEELPNLERLARRLRPVEGFLSLCSTEGTARFVLDGRLVEGTSYLVRAQPTALMLLVFRLGGLTSGDFQSEDGISTQTLHTITQLTQAMAASLDLENTIQAIFENVDRLLPADFMEVTIWDAEREWLVPYRVVGLPGSDRQFETPLDRYTIGQGYSGVLARDREPLLIPDVDERQDIRQAADRTQIPLHSYLGVPLIVGRELIGTLELGSLAQNTFEQKDLELIALLSGQAAIAIHNALLYRDEQMRAAELSGLASLAQAFSSARDPKGLYGVLVQSIVPLIQVEIVGFLIYEENLRRLAGQVPFYGLPPQFIEIYQAPMLPGSPLEQALLDQDLIISEDAMNDPQWSQLGLDSLASSASLHDTILVPLVSGGHMLGYLQVSNHVNGSRTYTKDEIRLLMIVANQAAPIIENATLVQQTRQRAQRAEALRRITSLASSSATTEEINRYSLRELAQLVRADVGAILLVDPIANTLRLDMSSLHGVEVEIPERDAIISTDDPQYPFTVTGKQHSRSIADIHLEKAIIPFYQKILAAWELKSMIAVPLVTRDQSVGEMWLGSRETGFFDQADIQVMITAGGQLAAVIEQSHLTTQTDESLRRRVDQLSALMRISRELSTVLDLPYLLRLVHSEALRITGADCGTIVLFDMDQRDGYDEGLYSTRFAVGDPAEELSAVEAKALETGQVSNIADTRWEEGYTPAHEGVLSTLIAPIFYLGKPAGIISLHATSANRFDDAAVEVVQSLANQASVAFGNAIQFDEQVRKEELLRRRLETQETLFQLSQSFKPGQPFNEKLSAIGTAIQTATPFKVVVISECDEQGVLHRVYGSGLDESIWAELRAHTQPWHAIQGQLLKPEYQFGQSYFIPADKLPVVPEEMHMVTILPLSDHREVDSWDADDMLVVPLFDSEGKPSGLISLDAPLDGRRPDRPTLDALNVFAAQAEQIFENDRRVNRLQEQVEELQAQRDRFEQESNDARATVPMLLNQSLERTLAIRMLNNQLDRLRASLEMAEVVGRQTDLHAMLHSIGRELISRFGFQVALIAERVETDPRLVEVIGTLPEGVNPEALFGQKNPLRQMLADQRVVLISNLDAESDWQSNPLLVAFDTRSMIGLPLSMGEEWSASILALGTRPVFPFQEQDWQAFNQLLRQINISIQNLQLLNDTRRRLTEVDLLLSFSQKLGSLNPTSILNTLMENTLQVLSSANAGWVALWDEKEKALFPQAAMGYLNASRILDIRFGSLAGSSAEQLLPVRCFQSGKRMRVSDVRFAQDYSLPSEDLMRYQQATGGRLPVSSLLVPLQLGEKTLGVLVIDNFDQSAAFSAGDESLAASLAQQTALALENARLFMAAEERAAQLQALTQVAGMITSSLQSRDLIASMLEQLKSVLAYDTATLWLREADQLSVYAASGFDDNESRVGLSVHTSDSLLFQEMINTGQPISVPDVRQDARFPSLLEPDRLSWLGLPLVAKGMLVGALALEKTEIGYYTAEHIQAATTFASQAAVALENARLFEDSLRRAAELDERSQRLALLNTLSSELATSLDSEFILKLAAQQLLSALNGTRVGAVMLNELGRYSLEVEVPSSLTSLPQMLPPIPLLEHLKESLGIFTTVSVQGEKDMGSLYLAYLAPQQIQSLLIVPLLTGSELHGWLWLQDTQSRRFSPSEIELARTICNQAAIAVQNARLYAETRQLKDDLELRVEERTVELRREHQNTQTLLRIITELSTSMEMNLVLNRTLTVLNESTGAEQSAIVLAQSGQITYQAGEQLVKIVDGANGEQTWPELEICKWVIRRRLSALVDDIYSDGRWTFTPGLQVDFRSVIAVPMILGEEVLGSLILLQRQPAHFMLEQVSLVEATARQIAIALNNAELFNLIRDQAERLGGMLREQQIEASRSRAILESVADGVLVTDAINKITLFNSSAEQILELQVSEVIQKHLGQFSGIFGKVARNWFQTIQKWSDNPRSFQSGETFSEQVELENGKVLSVHLAPVMWRSTFLGTVSIFRDITREVQVDRMKSEFIANVSHELRTPMTSIKGYAEIMLMGASGELSPQQTHFLEIIKSNAERLNVLVNDLLDISRVESGRVSLSYSTLNFTEIAEDMVSDIRRRSREENKPMQFELRVEPDVPLISGDVERMRQVLANLVSNAYNYTPENGWVQIHIHCTDAKEVQVDVQDNGIGIQPKDQMRVFERFYRGNDPLVLATAGTGLGLAMARTLIEMHGGNIWFQSSGVPGEGSLFSFTIPAEKPEDNP